jgi:hypothetical protein
LFFENKTEPPVMTKMQQENYARKQGDQRYFLPLNPLMGIKIQLFVTRKVKTEDKKHIELRENAATPIPAASSNYILSIIFY